VGTLQALQLAMGGSFAVAGLIAWRSRPGSRIGPLMVAYGAVNIAGRLLIELLTPLSITAGILLVDGAIALLVLILLTFPSGRFASRRDWLIMAPLLLAVGPLEVLWLTFLALPEGNALLIWPSESAASAVDTVQRALIVGAELALVALLVRRWLVASAARRRMLAPALVGSLAPLTFSVLLLWQKFVGEMPHAFQYVALGATALIPVALLASLLRARLARSAIGELLLDLQSRSDPQNLRDALARALGDPSLEIAYWLPEYGAYVDRSGGPMELPPEDDRRAITALDRTDGSRVAAMVHDPSLHQERDRLREVAAAASIALENARLHADLRARVDELRGSRARMLETADAERRRFERDLHDGAQQRLVTLSLSLGLLESRLAGDPEARALIAEAKREAAGSLEELRDLAHGIHPAVLTGHGLGPALESLAARAALPVGLDVKLPDRLPPSTEMAAYYLVCEALTNTAKHAHAKSVTVGVRRASGRVVVEVADDGVGGADVDGGSGLRGLLERVEALDGALRVESPAGVGTRVRAEIPCA
jgi:signal transduction histidine kinase